MDADEIIETSGSQPHPEGGWYTQTWRDGARPRGPARRSTSCSAPGERSHWHRVDAAETWHHYTGAPLELRIAVPGEPTATATLSPDLASGHRPQATVPAGAWQSAVSTGPFTLVGCTVAPALRVRRLRAGPAGMGTRVIRFPASRGRG